MSNYIGSSNRDTRCLKYDLMCVEFLFESRPSSYLGIRSCSSIPEDYEVRSENSNETRTNRGVDRILETPMSLRRDCDGREVIHRSTSVSRKVWRRDPGEVMYGSISFSRKVWTTFQSRCAGAVLSWPR